MSPARRKDGEGELLGQLEQLAGRIERGELRAPKKIAEALCSIIASRQAPPSRRGRPKGSKTEGNTKGVKLARRYLDLLCSGLRPTEAMRKVAKEFRQPHMHPTAPRNALKQHSDRLMDEDVRGVQDYADGLLGPAVRPSSLSVDDPDRISIDERLGDVFKRWGHLWNAPKASPKRKP